MSGIRRIVVVAFLVLGITKLSTGQEVDEAYIRDNYSKREVHVPMRDGKRLFTAIYAPTDTTQNYPMLLLRTPYGIGPYGSDAFKNRVGPSDLFTKEGFIFVYQDVRGKRMSEGEFIAVRPHIPEKTGPEDVDESSDTYDTIEWMLSHIPRNNGRVGSWGISAPGFYATHTLIDAHPALKAASPQAPVTDWFLGDDRHHNGAFMLQATFSFVSSFGVIRPEPSPAGTPGFSDYGTPDGYRWYLDLGPLSNINRRHLKGENPLWNAMMEHGTYDEWWQARTPLPHLKEVTVPTMVVGGFFDAQDLYGPLKTYNALRNSPNGPKILVMGPWWHGGWARGDGERYQDIHFGSKTSLHYRENIELRFFNHYLKDKDAHGLPAASIFITGSNRWEAFDQWPPARAETKDLYLHPGGDLSFEVPTGLADYSEYISDPDRPVPHTPKIVVRRDDRYVIQDQRFASTRPDVLVYETEPLEKDLTLAGGLEASLYVSTTGSDADFIVKLIDVYPDTATYIGENTQNVRMGGFQFMVRGEVMRAKFRNSFEFPEPMEPGQVTHIVFDMQDVGHTFLKGHRMMVQIQSTWFPMLDRNPQKFVDIYRAVPGDFQIATHRVYTSVSKPSHLRFNVIE
ncbi:MAG: CocE/NonD family hydrolase [Candidatus Latescibacteria bacterium]|nr:CocE/NonD family hydrolase [Candidatus Latescibacterota bacterium]